MPKTKQHKRPTRPTLSPADALNMLASALTYCQQAGLTIEAGNGPSGLTIILPGARLGQTEAGAVLEPVPAGEPPTA